VYFGGGAKWEKDANLKRRRARGRIFISVKVKEGMWKRFGSGKGPCMGKSMVHQKLGGKERTGILARWGVRIRSLSELEKEEYWRQRSRWVDSEKTDINQSLKGPAPRTKRGARVFGGSIEGKVVLSS